MRWLSRQIATMRRELNILLAISLGGIFLIEFVLSNFEEIVPGGARLGVLLSRAFLSYVTSYIFYFIVVHLKSRRDKANILPFLISKSEELVRDARGSYDEFARLAGVETGNEWPTDTQVTDVFSKTAPYAPIPGRSDFHGGEITSVQRMEYLKRRSKETIQRLFSQMPFLESKFVSLVVRIDNALYFLAIDNWLQVRFKNADLSTLAPIYFAYLTDAKALHEYIEKDIKPAM